MIYMLTIGGPLATRQQAQLWIEETFDLSVVTLLGLWDSPFRGQCYAKVLFNTDGEVKASNEAALNAMARIYPEEKRVLQNWEELKG